ncbi:putative phosphatidylinositol 4-kinase alpha [Leishmania infantum JPCM5]|uniref:1-phosphatidylinositol 4-kinase n=2 Tax=Leishmania infantum TaxID=5671 RepID=A4I4K7_LEIIN|nr:putative phosphatidylinositol 4-kinase alpha [Leishmania infantum JPCM5]CAC9508760.1 phosphatidylinositol_4-kinase_alpha_-_putative [Leishmania infantum]CAM69719.1 putative phosphatidylinositol 4-kinase alpha [Leishmania infantum JPCM5]SUZ43657.1 phosphatidylinositol_4-kinase_alpha_-_putative [Leishmania infantum]|eukprot:XP_001466676.1 putative phosphatidylinositol 4-kinase alpha [Leishmania infantum JPCM5]
MNDIRFPGWIKSSPTLVMASVLAQLLTDECAEATSSATAGAPRPPSEACVPDGRERWPRHNFGEDISSSCSDGGGGVDLSDSDASECEGCYDPDRDAMHSGGGVDTGYLRMVDRLLELNSKELDSLPPAAATAAATTYLPPKAVTAPATAMQTAIAGSWPRGSGVLFTRQNGGVSMSNLGASPDILRNPRVRTLLRLSRLNDVLTRAEAAQPLISRRTAAAMVSFFAFAVSCRYSGLPVDRTKGFFTECSALYTTLLSKLRSLRFGGGVSLEDFTAALVACGLKLRCDEDVEGDEKDGHGGTNEAGVTGAGTAGIPCSGRSNSSSAVASGAAPMGSCGGAGVRTPTQPSFGRDKNYGLVGFGHRALDAIFVRCIPSNIDECVHDPVALGVLRGISLTHSQQLFYLGPELVNHLHDLTDAFATSSHRRELSYKRVLSVLLEAISCSRVIDYERTNNWITAVIQERYVVRGLFQREELHAHVVTATLTMLIRQYQEMAKECASKVVDLGSMPDFTEGDQLIELVWKALQDTIGSWEDAVTTAEKHPLTLFRHNIDMVVQHLLRTEVERLRCYYIITSATAAYHQSLVGMSAGTRTTRNQSGCPPAVPQLAPGREEQRGASQRGRDTLRGQDGNTRRDSDAPAAAPYVPSAEEESLRILICSNIIKLLLLPTSIMNALPRTEEAKQLRASLTEAAARVLSVVTAKEFKSRDDTSVMKAASGRATTSAAPRSISPISAAAAMPRIRRTDAAAAGTDLFVISQRRAHFSNNFYRCIEELIHELIHTILQQSVPDDATAVANRSFLGGVPDVHPPTPPTSDASSDAILRGMVAAVCIQYMCSTNQHLRSFAISEVMDAVVRLSARCGAEEAATATHGSLGRKGSSHTARASGNNSNGSPAAAPQGTVVGAAAADPEEERKHATHLRARQLALCFDALSAILVPTVVVEGYHHVAEEQEERAGLARSCTTTSARGDSKREELSRYGQLLCDTYVDSLREHLWSLGEGSVSRHKLLTPVMTVAVKAFVNLVLRVHERLRGMSSMALALVQEAEAAREGPGKGTRRSAGVIARDRARLLHAFNAERMSVVLLLRGVIQNMLSVAWPSSGVLYQDPACGWERPLNKTTSAVMAPLALAVLSPFFRPLTMLLHLSTLFPVRSLKQLCTHYQYARYLTLEDPSTSDQYMFYYYRRLSRALVAAEADDSGGSGAGPAEQVELECWALFRSCWMMFSYYKYTAEALMAVRAGGMAPMESANPAAAAAALARAPILSTKQCKLLRLIAASAAPLLRMCSSDVQQAMADVAVLLRYTLAGALHCPMVVADVTAKSGIVHASLYKSLKRLCGGRKECWKRLSMGELMLLQCVAELEILRAAAGSVAQLTLYRHFEVREFVASAAIPEALGHILSTACDHYIEAVRSMLPGVAFQVTRTDLMQLVFLVGFAIGSVRESASKLVLCVVRSFPTYAAYASALPLLWCMLDLLEAGTAGQIESLCEHVRFSTVPAVAADPHSVERQQHVLFVADVAERWAAILQDKAPIALFETAIKFMVIQQQECGEQATTQAGRHHAGSRLAVLASLYRVEETPPNLDDSAITVMRGAGAAGHVVKTEYAQTLLLHGRAQGAMQASSWYASAGQMQSTVVAQLWAATRLCRRALASAVAQRLESNLLRPARALFVETGYSVGTVLAPRASTVADEDAAAQEMGVTRVPLGAPARAETAASFAAAVALLVTGSGTPIGRRQLLQYLVQGAVQTFRSDVLYEAILCWKWLLSQNREAYLLPMLQELDTAFVWTAANRLGLFDGYCSSKNRQVQTGDVPIPHNTVSARGQRGARVPEEAAVYVADNVDSASPHKLLLSFLADMYVEEGSPLCLSPEVLRQLYLVAAHIMQFAAVLSLRDDMFGETMRCFLVVGSIAQLLREANVRQLRAGLLTLVPFPAIGALRQRWYKALLRWFTKTPPSWYYAKDPVLAREEAKVLSSLSQLIKEEADLLTRTTLGFLDFSSGVQRERDMPHVHHWESLSVVREAVAAVRQATDGGEAGLPKLIVREKLRLQGLLHLLRVLVEHEVLRLSVWRTPRRTLKIPNTTPSVGWGKLIECADHHNPEVVVAMVYRFSSIPAVRLAASQRVVAHPERYSNVAEAVDLYLTEDVLRAGAPRLFLFCSCTIIQALRLLDPRYAAYKTVNSYAIRSLLSQRSEKLIFYLPQLLQLLATDESGSIEAFLVRTSARSTMFAHQLLWSLQTESEGSGALAKKCQQVERRIKAAFTPNEEAFYRSEFAFVDLMTSLSGEIMKFDKPERKAQLRLRLKDDVFHALPKLRHLYLPTDPNYRITDVIPHTAGAMQSAAKCPILVQFTCVPRTAEDALTPDDVDSAAADEHGHGAGNSHSDPVSRPVVKACIFKMGDDCRQDQISLQLIGLIQRILNSVGVPSFLYPYRVITTGQSSGIIECVPRSRSRNEIGKLVESNVAEFFVQTFGHPESAGFRRARENFVRSTAAYSVVSFILNIKDRHNGNIMIDADGNLVHIDFGFLFDTSPGGDINFESSPFKLTTEMVQLIGMDVSGESTLQSKTLARALVDEENYIYFKTLVNRCYLAVRQYAREICVMVELMLRSGLPCFKPKKTIADLAQRLAVDKNEIEAADYMRRLIHESRQNFTTVLYDYYQKVAEGIEM